MYCQKIVWHWYYRKIKNGIIWSKTNWYWWGIDKKRNEWMIDIHKSSYIHITATQGSTWGSEGAFSRGLVGFGWARPFTLLGLWVRVGGEGNLPSVIIGRIWKTRKDWKDLKLLSFPYFCFHIFSYHFHITLRCRNPQKTNPGKWDFPFFSLLSLLPRDMSNNSFRFHLLSISWI